MSKDKMFDGYLTAYFPENWEYCGLGEDELEVRRYIMGLFQNELRYWK